LLKLNKINIFKKKIIRIIKRNVQTYKTQDKCVNINLGSIDSNQTLSFTNQLNKLKTLTLNCYEDIETTITKLNHKIHGDGKD
jgi:hypothetical protein